MITEGEDVSFKKFKSVILFKLLGWGRMVRAMGGIWWRKEWSRRGRRGVMNVRCDSNRRRGKGGKDEMEEREEDEK